MHVKTHAQLKKLFQARGIDFNDAGFYDHPAFLEAETADGAFLDNYAAFVSRQSYTAAYLARARCEIPVIASACHDELVADGRLGACVDIGMMFSRILEQEGYWNYQVKGSLTIEFPPSAHIRKRYFWSFDVLRADQPRFAAAHSWIVAPPFVVADIALSQQPYDKGRELLPPTVVAESAEEVPMSIKDVFSPEYIAVLEHRGIPPKQIVATQAPHLPAFSANFPPGRVRKGELVLTYTPVGIGAPDTPFEQMNNWRCNGRLGIEIYRDLVVPALNELRAGLAS